MHHHVARRSRVLGLGAMLVATSLVTGAVIATEAAPAAAAACAVASAVTTASTPSGTPRQTATTSSRRVAASSRLTKMVVRKYGATWRATATVSSSATVLGSARVGAVYPMKATSSVLVTCGTTTTRVTTSGAASGSASSTASSRRGARSTLAAVAGSSSASRAQAAAKKLATTRTLAKATSAAAVSSKAIAKKAASATALSVSRSRGSAAAVAASRSALTAKLATLGAPVAAKGFPANATFDYQIGGAYTPSPSVAVVDRDRTDPPAAGKYNVCYINAFQSQPGESASWGSLLLRTSGGSLVQDSGWPGEYVVDTRQSAAVATFVGSWIKACAAKGYQAVELDNLDSYSRSGGLLSVSNNLDVFGRLVAIGHAAGVAVGQKNTVDQSSAAKALGADFAVAEECQVYSECSGYAAVYGNAWVEIEYSDSAYTSACTARGATTSVIRRDVNVVSAGSSGYVFSSC